MTTASNPTRTQSATIVHALAWLLGVPTAVLPIEPSRSRRLAAPA